MVRALSHPDLHWFIPIEPARRDADADKQVELAEEALGEALAARREQPLYGPVPPMAAHPMASVRLLLRRLVLTPAMGGARVFILADAERLRPQIGTDAAANALLKALEEPPHRTYFILTAADARALLPTVLSRVVRLRVPRLPDTLVTAFAQSEAAKAVSVSATSSSIPSVEGCIGRLLAPGGDLATAAGRRAEVFAAALAGGPVDRYVAALSQPPFEARGGFTEMLDGLLARLRAQAAAGGDTATVVRAIAHVLAARTWARGNANPQLVAAVLADDLAHRGGGTKGGGWLGA
jgi:DNA polymerase-3 subunit delta'